MAKSRRVVIYKTPGEWEVLDRHPILKKKELRKYLRSELFKLSDKYKDCPNCITPAAGQIKRREFYIDKEVYKILIDLSKKMQKPISCIVDDLFLVPLLQQKD